MAVNQPIIGSDQADNSWKLEVTAQTNNEEARVNALVARIEQLEAMLGITGGGGGAVQSVDVSGILRLSSTGRLSNIAPNLGALAVDNLVQLVDPNTIIYNFGRMIPDTHILYIGGQKLIETVDYNLADQTSNPGILTLTSMPDVPPDNNPNNFMIELSIWSI